MPYEQCLRYPWCWLSAETPQGSRAHKSPASPEAKHSMHPPHWIGGQVLVVGWPYRTSNITSNPGKGEQKLRGVSWLDPCVYSIIGSHWIVASTVWLVTVDSILWGSAKGRNKKAFQVRSTEYMWFICTLAAHPKYRIHPSIFWSPSSGHCSSR